MLPGVTQRFKLGNRESDDPVKTLIREKVLTYAAMKDQGH